jgi:metal-dependent amidase/aminoacylase/carboxypeptidase family protein
MVGMGDDLTEALDAFLARYETDLIGVRRDLHAHPEPGYAERRTTRFVADRLAEAGLRPVLLQESTGLYVDIGPGGGRVALRADLDALPMEDEKGVPYRSKVAGMCHACGHDVHTAMLSAVPPTVNEPASVALMASAAAAALGPDAVTETPQSLGGEDFAWYLHLVPGAMARLGTRTPGTLTAVDLHQPTFDIDERAIGLGVRVLASVASRGTRVAASE